MKTETRLIEGLGKEITFKIGKKAQENFDIIDDASPDDLWFHLENASSGHVVASIPADFNVDKTQLKMIAKQGAVICKEHSKLKSHKDVSVIYAKIRNITKSETTIGQVIIFDQKSIVI